jgi:hypothetical protein
MDCFAELAITASKSWSFDFYAVFGVICISAFTIPLKEGGTGVRVFLLSATSAVTEEP